jgi:hypothetical protein
VNDDDQVPSTAQPAPDDPAFDDPAFDDPAFDELRALLADVRVTEPLPAEVAGRLDATLASLHAERATPAPVVPLRRRLAPILAAAAVAVVVGGVGIAQLVSDTGGQRSTTADSAGSSEALQSAPSAAAPSPRAPRAPQAPHPATKDGAAAAFASVPVFTRARFAEQVASPELTALDALTGSADTSSGIDTPSAPSSGDLVAPTEGRVPAAVASQCAGPALPGTRSVPILLDSRPAALVLHPVADGEQLVEAWSCDGGERLASASVAR